MRLVLASASPARLGVLRAAGADPLVEVSDVDEDALLAAHPDADPARKVTLLAAAKAAAVAERIAGEHPDALVIGCDSMLLLDGDLVGKPRDTDDARHRWLAMAGRTGELLTGHAVLRLVGGAVAKEAEGHAVTAVRFAEPDPEELAAYLGTGEPLKVAGAFTLDGFGAWFIDGIDGDPSNVIGISLPLVRRLLGGIGVSVVDLWRKES
ncbi:MULTISPECIES: Maf family protein [Pseudonocardia]|uniref:Nucleoside triphosphate pyrophosphatase n=2 Tax=Pseudonocardia TaxID=1847 RepID=A0A1Y2MQW0_PSEAH|nr:MULTISPECIES: Maf family nucleotide pyrophosphatase [Pseudonocardia]OSY37606.1 Septum formation protein Maf [Pseudonocardia autotrophica]TDN73728.1 septum formation protein [Pseudonocardia autotrophica]BBG04471.1 Maf-like protein [Pseudonocardia autotrophica]GEC27283.1 Maf-like protein [Pseudonocardia saturnea]